MKLEVKTYAALQKCVDAFKKGTFNVLFIIGDHGQSKTTIVKKTMGIREGENHRRGTPVLVKGGSVSAFQLYKDLHEKRDEVFVFDDCDSLYTDGVAVRLLKALCETEVEKMVGWHTHNVHLESAGIPREFKTKSRVIIILNHWHTINKQVESLEDRGLMVFFKPPVEEVLKVGKKWFKDKEIIKFVENHRLYIQSLSLRAMVVAAEMKEAGLPQWRDALKKSLGIEELVIVDELIRNPKYIMDEERIKVFHEMTSRDGKPGLSRTTWFQLKKRLEELKKEYEKVNQETRVLTGKRKK